MIVVDASGPFSLLIETDQNHSKAIALQKKFFKTSDSAIIPEEVFSEFVNILGKKFDHDRAVKAASALLESQIFMVEGTNEAIRQSALEKYKKQPQSVSYTDCVVMAVADAYHTKEIIGFDKAFSQNGYKI